MKAVHPKTGKPISIMRTEAQVTKTKRTMVWLAPTFQGASQRWARWSTFVTDPEVLTKCVPDIAFLYDDPTPESLALWSAWLQTATNSTLIVATSKWMTVLKLSAAIHESVLVTEELSQRYPFLPTLTAKDSKESWVLAIAQLMRFHRIVSSCPLLDETGIFKGLITTVAKDAVAETTVPPIYLIQQYYVAPQTSRRREIKLALEMNIACPYIDKIILLNEKPMELPASDKITEVIINRRLTYLDVMKHIKYNVPKDTHVIFSNSDIYMDSTLRQLYSLDMDKKFLSLLRYDVASDYNGITSAEPKLFGPRPDSQDTWIVWSSSIDFEPSEADFGFSFGIPGCDNAITVSMLRKRFAVANPALSIKTYHIHSSNVRNYNASDVIDKPVFLYVEPTGIQEYNPVSDISKSEVKSWPRPQPRSFTRTIKYVDRITAETICNMMQRDSHYKYNVDSANTYNQGLEKDDNKLYEFKGTIFTMPAGVICDDRNLYVGEHHVWRDEWSKVQLTVLTNTVHVPELAAVHFPAPMANSAAHWFLHYLPKVLDIRKHTDARPEFIVPVHPDTQRMLKMLNWPEKGQVTIIPYLGDCQYVSEKVYALTPLSFHDVPAESIDFLRSMLPEQEPSQRPIAVIVSERDAKEMVSRDWAASVISNIFHRKDRGHWDVHIVDAEMPTETRMGLMMKADLVIAPSESEWEALTWTWLMKKGATVVEIMPDTKPRGDHIHIAGASGLNYVLLGVKREPIGYQRQHAMEDIDKIINTHLFAEALKAQVPKAHLPLIVVPSGKALVGMHNHSGDTFREMVDIWAERGYCNIERREDTPYVWWGSIGHALLYDRPTMRWFTNPSYKMAFYGNACPEKPTRRDHLWTFWPRSPKALEKLVATNKQLTSYADRKILSIFLGRIENGVQQERRQQQDWSKSVHTFSMPIDSTGGPYKYSQEEYLDQLTNSRFGLCLPGYGPKCNREIEYFATGTVPIITPGVDMKNYKVPPQEGVHYFVAQKPEDVKKIVDSTSVEKWSEMSIACRGWWRRFASAEGMFRLTWGLVSEATEMLSVVEVMEKAR
jgi:hypothetical protein